MSNVNIPQALLKQARKSGNLNLCNRDLTEVPSAVWNLNRPPVDDGGAASFDSEECWWDFVELTKLNLASNKIKSISEDLINFPQLVTLDAHDNQLASLPLSFSKLKNLKKIDLCHNLLSVMPQFESSGVVVLLLQHNKLTELEMFKSDLSVCELLNLSYNSLTDLSPLVDNLVNLRSLDLSMNQLSSLPLLHNLKHLTILILNNNKLKSLSIDFFGCFVSLQQLHIRNNLLEHLPSLQACNQLVELYVGNNALNKVPEFLPESIVQLELRDNKIKDIPERISAFAKLERLDIANNNVSQLPPELGNMRSIKVIVLDGNPLRSLRRDIINRGTQAVLQYLKSRITASSGDANVVVKNTALPQSKKSEELQRKHLLSTKGKLILTKESVQTVEDQLREAEEITLTEIALTRCSLTSFPQKLLMQKHVSALNLSSNKLSDIPSSISLLVSLVHVDFTNNNLSQLPCEFESLVQLREINISYNKFSQIPNCLLNMKQLEHLFADGNQIASLNVSHLQNLQHLITLSVQNNSIGQVPPQLALLKSLQTLKLEGNTFRMPRQGIVQKGSAAVLEYLRSRLPN